MPAMRVRELEKTITELINQSDHPEILRAETYEEAGLHSTKPVGVKVSFASGAAAFINVLRVEGKGVPRHPDYQLPSEVL
ncbi:MAG TPA: hypothetical protein VIL00_11005 [Pseudonocardiaceae bacterium]